MKRIAIFCDGTWNRMSADEPTNVLIAAQAVLPSDAQGVVQVVHYNEGVGTSYVVNEWVETRLAGAFGWGLFDKVADAYRYLIFNYEPGDEIYIFGFSRGAFTARSLAGLIRKCGVVPKASGRDIKKAFAFYQLKGVAPDDEEARVFRRTYSPQTISKEEDRAWLVMQGMDPAAAAQIPLLDIRYIGVWDTVEALGLPKHLHLSQLTGRIGNYEFHDARLSSTVHAARHAVATDETRLSFRPTLWDNLPLLNVGPKQGLYEQRWFAGNHGSVGGGGPVRGLSNNALLWILAGAQAQGLAFSPAPLAEAQSHVDGFAPAENTAPGQFDWVFGKGPRDAPLPGDTIDASVVARMARTAGPDWPLYRPPPLKDWWP